MLYTRIIVCACMLLTTYETHRHHIDRVQCQRGWSLQYVGNHKCTCSYDIFCMCIRSSVVSQDVRSWKDYLRVSHRRRPGHDQLQILYEQWIQCDGHWSESSFLKEIRVTNRHRKKGARKWMTKAELTFKYQSWRIAERIAQAKENDAELSKSQVRPHPDCPDEPETSMQKMGYAPRCSFVN